MTSLLAVPATSRRVPRLALVENPTTLDVPLRLSLPLARGVPAVGLTRTFCQASLQRTPLALDLVTVKTNCVLLIEVNAAAAPLATPLMFRVFLPLPARRVINTFGAAPPVSKMNPLGALRMIVPVPTL